MKITEQLVNHARDLAQSVGGRQTVEVWVWVALVPGQSPSVNCQCVVGRTGMEIARGAGSTIEHSFTRCIEDWRKKGAVLDATDAEVKRIAAQAEKLGYTLTPVAKPEPATV